MTRFVQIHTLTNYPASNLNRDDTGRPKTVIVGGTNRLRVSSQSLKRAWRTSEVFKSALDGHIGTRTKRIGEEVRDVLVKADVTEAKADEWAAEIAQQFGKRQGKSVLIEQLAHIGPEEREAALALARKLAEEKRKPTKEELELLRKKPAAADIAMFGRMLAAVPEFNIEAAVQVGHAFTVHPVTVEDDYFTAVDDLKRREDDSGAGHVGVHEFGAGVFYGYVCVDRTTLIENLNGDSELADRALAALIEAMATVSPSGKQSSFASRAYASYVLVEKGEMQPRTLAGAFLDGVTAGPVMRNAVDTLRARVEAFDRAYGTLATSREHVDVERGEGSLDTLKKFIQG